MPRYTAIMKSLLPGLALTAFSIAALAQQAQAPDPCSAFSWNVTHERELFAAHATAGTTGTNRAAAPLLDPDRLYELQLNLLAQVQFAAPPGKSKGGNGPYAGLALIRVPKAGLWRIALDQPAWIDVVADGQPIASNDYQGRAGCHAPHKIVQFQLSASQPLIIQLSGTPELQVRLTITRGEDSPKP
jgi:hypothetical protein